MCKRKRDDTATEAEAFVANAAPAVASEASALTRGLTLKGALTWNRTYPTVFARFAALARTRDVYHLRLEDLIRHDEAAINTTMQICRDLGLNASLAAVTAAIGMVFSDAGLQVLGSKSHAAAHVFNRAAAAWCPGLHALFSTHQRMVVRVVMLLHSREGTLLAKLPRELLLERLLPLVVAPIADEECDSTSESEEEGELEHWPDEPF